MQEFYRGIAMKTCSYIIILGGLFCNGAYAETELSADKLAGYRQSIQAYGGALKQELTSAIKSGGAIAALEVCHLKAPKIAQQISEKAGISVARTSLKPRNAASAPDAWEEEVLNTFEVRKAKGEDVNTLEFHAIVEEGGKREARYMKAIPTAELCLNCHGSKIQPDVLEKITALYPQDKAVDFNVGDLRGAFTVRETLTTAQ
jgi:hypothetical protein